MKLHERNSVYTIESYWNVVRNSGTKLGSEYRGLRVRNIDGCVNRNHCFTCITYAQKVMLLTASTLQNNPQGFHMALNTISCVRYSMGTTSLRSAVKTSSVFANRFPVAASSISEWDQSHMAWDQRSTEGVARSPTFTVQKVLDTSWSVAFCIIMEDYCIV